MGQLGSTYLCELRGVGELALGKAHAVGVAREIDEVLGERTGRRWGGGVTLGPDLTPRGGALALAAAELPVRGDLFLRAAQAQCKQSVPGWRATKHSLGVRRTCAASSSALSGAMSASGMMLGRTV